MVEEMVIGAAFLVAWYLVELHFSRRQIDASRQARDELQDILREERAAMTDLLREERAAVTETVRETVGGLSSRLDDVTALGHEAARDAYVAAVRLDHLEAWLEVDD